MGGCCNVCPDKTCYIDCGCRCVPEVLVIPFRYKLENYSCGDLNVVTNAATNSQILPTLTGSTVSSCRSACQCNDDCKFFTIAGSNCKLWKTCEAPTVEFGATTHYEPDVGTTC